MLTDWAYANYAECNNYTECYIFIAMLSGIILNVAFLLLYWVNILSVVLLIVTFYFVVLGAIILNVTF